MSLSNAFHDYTIIVCRGECESVVHVLWECPAYDSIRNNFMVELENLLGGEVWGV